MASPTTPPTTCGRSFRHTVWPSTPGSRPKRRSHRRVDSSNGRRLSATAAGSENVPEHGLHAEHLEKFRGDPATRDGFDGALIAQVFVVPAIEGGDPLHTLQAGLRIGKVVECLLIASGMLLQFPGLVERDDAIVVHLGQRARVEELEDRDVDARQCAGDRDPGDGDRGGAGPAPKRREGEREVDATREHKRPHA